MKTVIIETHGGPEVLKLVDLASRPPGPGEVLLRVTSLGLNRADILFRQGRYLQKAKFPSRTGMEFAGIVEAAGEGAQWKPGDRVASYPSGMEISAYGGCAEYTTLRSDLLIPTPASLSDADAAAPWMAYYTAWGALNHVVKTRPGQFVVITAASSSVGIAALQIVNLLGGVPIATTTSAAKIERLKAEGAAHVIDMTGGDYVERMKQITGGRGAEIIFDAVAGPGIAEHVRASAMNGWIFLYGALDLNPPVVHVGWMVGKNTTIRGYSLRTLLADREACADATRRISEAFDMGRFRLVVDRRFPLSEIREAHEYMESNRQFGKIVVNP